MNSLHPFEFSLHPIPIGLHVLGVNSCAWIHEVERVVDRVGGVDGRQLLDSVVGRSLVTVWTVVSTPEVLLEYGEQCDCSPVRDNCHDSRCRCLAGVTHATSCRGGRPQWYILKVNVWLMMTTLSFQQPTLGLRRNGDSSICTVSVTPVPPSISGESWLRTEKPPTTDVSAVLISHMFSTSASSAASVTEYSLAHQEKDQPLL